MISAPIVLRASAVTSLFSHSRTGSLPDALLKNTHASFNGDGVAVGVTREVRVRFLAGTLSYYF